VRLIGLRSGAESVVDLRGYELFAGDLVLTNAEDLWARYQYEPPAPAYPEHFIQFLVTALIEELAGVFGHNLNTQSVYRRRANDPFGALGIAIQTEQRQNPSAENRMVSRLAVTREW
jgi:hypothetical protein